ncbi:MAG TPA: M48 family metallopeptidase [Vicinamibacterales bacterium]|nr:M48 family metallopeptidase [Vicinamibacterales bacterium]
MHSQWESRPKTLAAVLGVFVLIVAAGYHFGIPIAARFMAFRIPAAVTTAISDRTLDSLDGSVLQPSTLPELRQQQLASAFASLEGPGRAGSYRLVFRDTQELGANALALPSGTIVVTDVLVQLARDDREIMGVLAHEAGHVQARHGLRLLLQNSALTLTIGWIVGDVTSVIAVAPAVILQTKYSRDFEREADAIAADTLRARGIPPSMLADLLERIDAGERSAVEEGEGAGGGADGPRLLDYTSSHPPTRERLDYLRSR